MGKHLHRAFASKDPERFAGLLEKSENTLDALDILRDIPDGLECLVVNRLAPEAALQLLGSVSDSTLTEWLEAAAAEDSSCLLTKVKAERASNLISGVQSRSKRRNIRRLLAYPEDSIGRLLQLDMILVNKSDTVAEIDARIKGHKGPLDGPIVVLRGNGEVTGVLDPVRFLQNRSEAGTASDFCIPVSPVFADSQATSLRLSARWAGQKSLPVVDHRGQAIGYISREVLENSLEPNEEHSPLVYTLVELSRLYWLVLLQAMMLLIDRGRNR